MPDLARLCRELLALAGDRPDLAGQVADLVRRIAPCRHGRDFACVVWHGTAYHFSPSQGRIVQILWEAWEAGVPDVRAETLLLESGSECARLVDVFKGHAAWNTAIVSHHRGAYRLGSPAPQPAPETT